MQCLSVSAFVSTCLLSLAELIYGGGRYLKVEYSPSPAPDGLELAVTDVTPPLRPFNIRVTSGSIGGNEITWNAEAECATIEGWPVCCLQ